MSPETETETEKFLWRWEEKVKCPQICVPCIPPLPKEELEKVRPRLGPRDFVAGHWSKAAAAAIEAQKFSYKFLSFVSAFLYIFFIFFLSLFFLLSSLPLGSSRLHFSETDITNPFQAKLRDWALSRTIYQPGFSCSGRGLGLKLKPRRRRRRQRIPCQLGFLGNRDFSLVARRHARLIASPSKADHKKANL